MPIQPDTAPHAQRPLFAQWARGWSATLALVFILTALRILYVVFVSPYPLVEDEAHYWEWSRRPGWSYYSKGPGIAWAIAASTSIFGSHEWSVRLVPIVSAALTTIAVAGLASDIFKDRRAGFFAAACLNLALILQSTSLLATIDSPYMAAWALASWAGWRAISGTGRAWPLVGLLIGAAFLFKYTALLLVPGILIYAIVARRRGWSPPSNPLWVAAGFILLALCFIPVAVWNIQFDWPTLRHLLGHLRVEGGDVPAQQGVDGWNYSPTWTLGYLGTQLALGGPMLFLSWGGFSAARRRRPDEPSVYAGALYAVLCAAPVLVFYFLVSFATKPQGNWAAGAFPTLAALAGGGLVDGMDRLRAAIQAQSSGSTVKPDFRPRAAWRATVTFGLATGIGMLLLHRLANIPRIGPRVPLHRLLGAPQQATHVSRLMDDLRRSTGKEPFVISQHYGAAGQLAFYLPGRPTTYCSSSRLGGRKNQYDYWADTDLDDPALRGRPAVMLGSRLESWEPVFDRVEVVGKLDGDLRPKRNDRTAFTGVGFRGFTPPENP